MNDLVTLKNVSKNYRRGSETIHALQNVTLKIGEGEFNAILGPSGSGKSTLLQVIGCLDSPDSGDVIFDGETLQNAKESKLTRIRSKKVGFVFQQFFLQPTLTALENVQVPGIFANRHSRAERAEQLLVQVGLGHRLHHRPSALSGGEMQRVAIARALINEPKLLLADEPTGSLDTETAASVVELFDQLREGGLAILLVTHNPELAGRATRCLRMQNGRLREE